MHDCTDGEVSKAQIHMQLAGPIHYLYTQVEPKPYAFKTFFLFFLFCKPTRMLLEDEQTEGTNSQQPLFRAAADFEFPCMLDCKSSKLGEGAATSP